MTISIVYDGDLAGLTLDLGASADVLDRGHGRALVHGIRWDGNLSRLTFDPGTATDMELTLRRAGKWPRYRRKPTKIRPGATPEAPPDTPPTSDGGAFSDGGLFSSGGIYSDGTSA